MVEANTYVSVGRHVVDEAVLHKGVEEDSGVYGTALGPQLYLARRRQVSLLIGRDKLLSVSMLQAVIVLESGAVDSLKRNAIRHSVEGLRNVHHYGNCYAKGLSLIEVGHYVRSNRDQCRGGVGPWLGCCWYVAEGGGAGRPPDHWVR